MTPTPWPKLAFAQRSDPGREPAKQVNEDAAHYQETPLGHLLVVCDGMGGHSSGREASNLAISVIAREVSSAPPGSNPGEVLRNAVVSAGRQVFSLGGIDNNPSRPGSTCVALLMHPGGTEVAHIGDSRAYLVRKGQIWPLTRDHSMVQQMVDAGLLRPEEAAAHPDSNKITRALGMRPDSDVELRVEPMLQEARDLFLLITDGVSDVIPDAELQSMAGIAAETGGVDALCEQIIALANARGGPDNCTVQAAYVVDPGVDFERVRARVPAPTQIDLEGPPGMALESFGATPVPASVASAASPPAAAPTPGGQGPAAPPVPLAPALERGPQRTVPLAMLPAGFGAGQAPPAAFATGQAPPAAFGTGQAPPAAFGPGHGPPPGAFGPGQAPPAFGAAAPPPAASGAAPSSKATGGIASGTIPFALTPAAGLPAAGSAGVGIVPPGPNAPPQPSPAMPAPPPAAPTAPTRRWGWVALGVALFVLGAALVAGIAWWVANEDETPPDLPEAPASTDGAAAPGEAVPAAPPTAPAPPATPPRATPSAHPPAVRAPPKVSAPPAASIVPSPPPPKGAPPASIVPSPPPPKTPAPATTPTR